MILASASCFGLRRPTRAEEQLGPRSEARRGTGLIRSEPTPKGPKYHGICMYRHREKRQRERERERDRQTERDRERERERERDRERVSVVSVLGNIENYRSGYTSYLGTWTFL